MRRFDIVFALALGMTVAAPSVPAAGARPVDPQQMQRAPQVARPGPIDARIVGAWDVWIPGSVYYLADGRQVTQHYQAGAAMNRLEIASDGRYRWGAKSGRLEEVLPWHHQPGRRYFRVVHASGNEYEFYHGDGDRLVVLFGGVGGHAATGSRLGGSPAAAASQAATRPPANAIAPSVGAKVEIKWGNTWYPGRIQRAEGGRFLVSYDGYGSNWDEWVDATRLRGGATPAPAPVPEPAPVQRPAPTAPSTGNTGNPLGVEWHTASAPAPAPTPTPAPGAQGTSDAGNPLGIDWATAQRPSTSTPAAPAPSPTPPAPLPVAPPGEQVAAHPIADRWKYIAAAFHGSDGRVDDALGVGGTLHLKDNGEYEQSLVIGGIANVVRGTWELRGDQITTRYSWRGQPASDVMQAHLRADGKRLTLVRQGSPTAYYTLDRIE